MVEVFPNIWVNPEHVIQVRVEYIHGRDPEFKAKVVIVTRTGTPVRIPERLYETYEKAEIAAREIAKEIVTRLHRGGK